MTESLAHTLLLDSPRCNRGPKPHLTPPSVSPTNTASTSMLDDDEEEEDEEERQELSRQERLLRSPTDKLLSPVSKALRAHHKRSPRRVRTSLASLLDVAL